MTTPSRGKRVNKLQESRKNEDDTHDLIFDSASNQEDKRNGNSQKRSQGISSKGDKAGKSSVTEENLVDTTKITDETFVKLNQYTGDDEYKSHKSQSFVHKKLGDEKEKFKENKSLSKKFTMGGDKVKSFLNSNDEASLIDKLELYSDDNEGKDDGQVQQGFLIFRAHNAWRLRWEFFVLMIAVWNGFSVPYNVAFYGVGRSSVAWFIVNTMTDVIFFIDLLINFRTTYLSSRTNEEIFDGKKIAIQYLKGRFWIDLIATVPIDYIVEPLLEGDANSTVLQMLGLLKLVRVLRLSRLITFMNLKDDIKMSLKLIKLIFFLVLYLHLIA